jgi:hypothetical protein
MLGVQFGVGHQGIGEPPSHTIVPVSKRRVTNNLISVSRQISFPANHNPGQEKSPLNHPKHEEREAGYNADFASTL